MTTWLKWRLCALLGTGLLCVGATYLRAQGSIPPPANTPEEAATQFYTLLAALDPTNDQSRLLSQTDVYLNTGIIAREQSKRLNNPGQVRTLFQTLIRAMHAPQYEAHVTGQDGNRTLVQVTPATAPIAREVVTVAEDGGYRVDLKATYGKWSNLSGEPLDEAWYRYTGEVTDAIRQSPNFLRMQCQSNLKLQMLGILQYAQDYDDKLPPARKWMTVVQPYVNSKEIFTCPALTKTGHGYAYNQNLSQINDAGIQSVASTISIYETSNLSYNAFGPGTGRAYRHPWSTTGEDGWNLGFADGHVKWFKRSNTAPLQFKP